MAATSPSAVTARQTATVQGNGNGGNNNSHAQQRFAFVTLVTTDAYLPGALVLAHSLRSAHSPANKPQGALTPSDLHNLGPGGLSNRVASSSKKVDTVCLVTPASVSVRTTKTLLRYFDKVVGVEPLSFTSLAAAKIIAERQQSSAAASSTKAELKEARRVRNETRKKLALLGRPDLGEDAGASLTKLHAWRLTGYDKVIYLDADILVLRPLAHLFSITSNLAASPDIGWPDSFNTGLMVLTPSLSTFSDLRDFAVQRGSWDGADQGLLNDYYGGEQGGEDAGQGGGWQRLPFRYNVTPNAGYTFTPAYQRYGAGIMTAHFIGAHKPWNQPKPNAPQQSLNKNSLPTDHQSLLYLWHAAFQECYPSYSNASGMTDVIHTERGVEVVERAFSVPSFRAVWNLEGDLFASHSSSSSGSEGVGSGGRRTVRTRRQRAPSASLLFRGAGQAEDLKEMFDPSIVAASAVAELELLTRNAEVKPNEGVYISLPLDARTSLMAAQLDSGDEQDSADSDETVNVDSSRMDISRHGFSSSIDNDLQDGLSNTATTTASVGTNEPSSTSGEWSPPKVNWDPARSSPPTSGSAAEYQMRNPIDNFYVNAWDQPASSQPRGKRAFFSGSESNGSRTLDRLQREHFFDNLGSDQPDIRKVKAVFPWEASQKTKKGSSRIFPDEEPASVVPGSQDMNASLAAGSMVESSESASDERRSHEHIESRPSEIGGAGAGTGTGGLPDRIAYTNAWDQIESISRYAARRMPSAHARQHQGVQTQAPQAHRGTQTSHDPIGGRGGRGGRGGAAVAAGPHDHSADQSGDGDNESSSSSDDEIVERGGASWRREGPGPGYQRKAGGHSHTGSGSGGGGGGGSGSGGGPSGSSRSPRQAHAPLSTTAAMTTRYGAGASLHTMPSLYIHGDAASPRSQHPFMTASGSYFTYDDVPPYEQLLASHINGATGRRRMGSLRTPTHSRPSSAHNSGASSPVQEIAASAAIPEAGSPRYSRTDLASYLHMYGGGHVQHSSSSGGSSTGSRNGGGGGGGAWQPPRRTYRRTYDA